MQLAGAEPAELGGDLGLARCAPRRVPSVRGRAVTAALPAAFAEPQPSDVEAGVDHPLGLTLTEKRIGRSTSRRRR